MFIQLCNLYYYKYNVIKTLMKYLKVCKINKYLIII